jgi:hypothetical protein
VEVPFISQTSRDSLPLFCEVKDLDSRAGICGSKDLALTVSLVLVKMAVVELWRRVEMFALCILNISTRRK